MTLDAALTAANFVLAAILFAIFVGRRTYRSLPIFVAYSAYSLLFGLSGLAVASSTPDYVLVWAAGTAVDTLFYLSVLVELGKAALRYNRASAPPSGVVLLLFLAASLPIWMLTQWPDNVRFQLSYQLDIRIMRATTVLEVAALLTLAWWSGAMKLRWPERELHLVVGMGSWALVQLCVLVLHEQGLMGPPYHWLDLLTPASVLCVLVYWLHYFWLDPGSMTEIANGSAAAGVAEPAGESGSHLSNRMRPAGQE